MIAGIPVLHGKPPYLLNWMHQNQAYDVDVYFSTDPDFFTTSQ